MRSDVQRLDNPLVEETLTTFEDGSFRFDYKQDAAPIFDFVSALRGEDSRMRGQYARRYLGTVPSVMEHQWLMESGLQYGSKEWLAFVKRKLQDREYRLLQGHRL